MHYDLVNNYAMKCRLYPSNTQKKLIDDALTAVKIYHNCMLYDIWNRGHHSTEMPKKGGQTGETVHFISLKSAFTAQYKNKLLAEHPIIRKCPQGALTTNVGLKADILKEIDSRKPIEYQKPRYYNDLHPRLSYTYQEKLGKLRIGDNRKVLYMKLAMIGEIKIRGWNQKLRFGNDQTDFAAWAAANPNETITVTVCKDLVGDYYLVFKIKNCLKSFAPPPANEVGVDVGIKDLAICSDADTRPYPNPKFKKAEKKHQRALNRRLSRRWGPSNEEFRAAAKANRAERKQFFDHPELRESEEPPPLLLPSKRYQKVRNQHARLNRSIARKRESYNHKVSKEIVEKYGLIALESLNVKGMTRNKHLADALTDAAFGGLLANIQYKANWHHRNVVAIDKWQPSSKRCSVCGYIYSSKDQYHLKPWTLAIRNWTCPNCHTKHDRDFNAACNILYYAKNPAS